MRVGMLWLDSSTGQALDSRLEQAASYYRQKYGQVPNLCFVHPDTEAGNLPPMVGSLRIQTDRAVLPRHFWLGVQEPSGN